MIDNSVLFNVAVIALVLLINGAIIFFVTKDYNPSPSPSDIQLIDNTEIKQAQKSNWWTNNFPKIIAYDDENSVNLGENKANVIKLLQEPMAKNVSEGGVETWNYKEGTLYIKGDVVSGWSNRKGLLNVKHFGVNYEAGNTDLKLGTSFEEVLNRSGTPMEINLSYESYINDIRFKHQTLGFTNNKLASYDNHSGEFNILFKVDPPLSNCDDGLQVDLGVKSDHIYACLGMPLAITKRRSQSTWEYENYVFTIKGGEVSAYSKK